MPTPPSELPGHVTEPSVRPGGLPLLPPFGGQPARCRRTRPGAAAVTVRRIPLPQSGPPYDDQAAEPAPAALPAGLPGSAARPSLAGPGVSDLTEGSWPGRFAQVLAETLAGSRPAQQLRPWTTERAQQRIRQLTPQLQADQRPRVRRVRTFAPDRDVIEMTIIVSLGPQVRALAVRLERSAAGRPAAAQPAPPWRCTAIEAA